MPCLQAAFLPKLWLLALIDQYFSRNKKPSRNIPAVPTEPCQSSFCCHVLCLWLSDTLTARSSSNNNNNNNHHGHTQPSPPNPTADASSSRRAHGTTKASRPSKHKLNKPTHPSSQKEKPPATPQPQPQQDQTLAGIGAQFWK